MITRRGFLAAAGAVPAVLLGAEWRILDLAGRQLRLNAAQLGALGEVVLPSELGPDGVAEVVDEFIRWAEGYRAGAERAHGYGTSEIRFLGPSPLEVWVLQLAQLNGAAEREHGASLVDLDAGSRRALVEVVLEDERGLGSPLSAGHVVLALMSWFCDSPRAVDLCYRARIGRRSCRPLPVVTERPAPLGGA